MKKLLLVVLLIVGCDNSTEAEDCAGVAGGDAVVDVCGVCGGDGSSCVCMDGNTCEELAVLLEQAKENYDNWTPSMGSNEYTVLEEAYLSINSCYEINCQ